MNRISTTFFGPLLLALFLVGCDLTVAIDDDNRYHADASFSYTMSVDSDDELDLTGINGTITLIRTSSTDELVVSGERRVESSSRSDARSELENLSVEIDRTADRVFVETKQPSSTRNREYEVTYVIELPAGMKAYVYNENGNVEAENAGRTPDIFLVNGTVRLEHSWDSATISVTNGRIVLDVELEENGTLDLSVVNGNVELGIPASTSAALAASVTNGSINTSGLTIEKSFESQTTLLGALGQGNGEIDIQTVNGSIDVHRSTN